MTRTQTRTGSAWIILLCAIALIGTELAARILIPRISTIEKRVTTERDAARAIRPQVERGQVLLVGNSLLEASVRVDQLSGAWQPAWRVQRFVVEDTSYLDWYFGLKTLLESGTKPNVVAMMLSPKQLLKNQLRGTYSAYHLMSARNALEAGGRAGYGLTDMSGLLIGHLSAAYGLRTEIRNVAMQKAVPHPDALAQAFKAPRGIDPSWQDPKVMAQALSHLSEFKALCDRYGVRCVLIPAPELHPGKAYAEMTRAGQSAGLASASFAMPAGYVSEQFQSDRFHMNATGAQAYTAALGIALAEWLPTQAGR